MNLKLLIALLLLLILICGCIGERVEEPVTNEETCSKYGFNFDNSSNLSNCPEGCAICNYPEHISYYACHSKENCKGSEIYSFLPHSMKGYELYSWQVDDKWYFTLITGTNRIKGYEEITSSENIIGNNGWVKITVKGVDSIKVILKMVPEGEYVNGVLILEDEDVNKIINRSQDNPSWWNESSL